MIHQLILVRAFLFICVGFVTVFYCYITFGVWGSTFFLDISNVIISKFIFTRFLLLFENKIC